MAAFPRPSVVLVTLLLLLVHVDVFTVKMTGAKEDECPPWFKWENTTGSRFPQCICSKMMPYSIECSQEKQRSSLRLASCIFHVPTINDTVVAICSLLFPDRVIKNGHIRLPANVSELNNFICSSLSRKVEEPLCGKCTNGTGPSIYSVGNQCVPCSPASIVYYLLLLYLPTTLLFLAIVLLRVNVAAAPMAHYVLFCNALMLYFKFDILLYTQMTSTNRAYISIFSKIVLSLKAVWSFDALFFVSPPLCISQHMEDIYKPFLDFLATLYPFTLLLLTYVGIELQARDFKPVVVLCKPFYHLYVHCYKSWNPNASMIQAFASLFFLSYIKLIILIYEPFLTSSVQNKEGHVIRWTVYIDPTVPFLAQKHLYLISLSVFIFLFLFAPPLILLIVYPTSLFRLVSRRLRPKWSIAIKTYADTFHGCYKDGTNGTRDYRAVSGYLLAVGGLLPALQITLAATIANRHSFSFPVQVSLLFFGVLISACALLQPYRHRAANMSGVTLPTILALTYALFVSVDIERGTSGSISLTLILILLCIPHCVLYGYAMWRLIRHCRRRHNGEGEQFAAVPRPTNAASSYTPLVGTSE